MFALPSVPAAALTVPPGSALLAWGERVYAWVVHLLAGWGQVIAQTALQLQQGTVAIAANPALWQGLLYWLLVAVMGLGIIGSFVPVLPGITLVLAAMVVWGLVQGFAGLAVPLAVAAVAVVLSFAIDYLAGVIGAQRVGASRWGQIGAFVGMALGLFGLLPFLPTGIPFIGLILGTVAGAFAGEFLYRRELNWWPRTRQSAKVGLAIVVGSLVGNVLQGILAFATTLVFVVVTWPGA